MGNNNSKNNIDDNDNDNDSISNNNNEYIYIYTYIYIYIYIYRYPHMCVILQFCSKKKAPPSAGSCRANRGIAWASTGRGAQGPERTDADTGLWRKGGDAVDDVHFAPPKKP